MSAPFTSALRPILPEWIDYNGHMNMAYYNVLFDTAVDEVYGLIGFGPDYQKTGFTSYVAEFHVCYLRELKLGDEVKVTFQVVDFDEKRVHTYQEIWHRDGWCAATAEGMVLHIDQSGPKVAPMPAHILAALETYHVPKDTLPASARIGRRIGITR
ncbi:thioesterase family protein [Sulfitobacter sp. JB4-11]|uniref:thioesterase family protein n=1 Tax=Sulfitobacter rhodophyticola TaxID=3238304 RepID=UPI003511C32F